MSVFEGHPIRSGSRLRYPARWHPLRTAQPRPWSSVGLGGSFESRRTSITRTMHGLWTSSCALHGRRREVDAIEVLFILFSTSRLHGGNCRLQRNRLLSNTSTGERRTACDLPPAPGSIASSARSQPIASNERPLPGDF
jgi:hypothetical protein